VLALFALLPLWGIHAGAAGAAPIQVQITGASVTVEVALGGMAIGGSPFGQPLDVVGNSLDFDPAVPRIDGFSILVQGDAASQIVLTQPVDIGLGAFDRILVNSALLTSIPAATYPAQDLGAGSYQFMGVPVAVGNPVAGVTSSIALSNSGGGSPVLIDPFVFPIASLSSTLLFSGLAPGDALDFGIVFPVAKFEDVNGRMLLVSANMLLTGTVVPEPATVSLLLFGLAALGAVGCRRRAQSSR
jgi:hypothetical protein